MITELADHVYTDDASWTDDTCEGITEAEAESARWRRPLDLDDEPKVGDYYVAWHEADNGECYVAGKRDEWVMFPEDMEHARRAVRDLNNGAPEWYVRGYPIGEDEQIEWQEYRAFHAGQLA